MGSEFQLRWHDGERRFLDYVVDGESLFERHGRDGVSPLGWGPPEEDERAARQLLGEAPGLEGRVAIWVCELCGALECGAITARVTIDGDEIVWSDFADSWPDYPAGVWVHDARPWDPIRFDAASYRAAIEGRPPPIAVPKPKT